MFLYEMVWVRTFEYQTTYEMVQKEDGGVQHGCHLVLGHLENRPLTNQTALYHAKSELVQYSDPHLNILKMV